MAELKRIRRPSPSLIKLVESVGILLELRKSDKKSQYKAPLPTNYDTTLDELGLDFSGVVGRLAALQSQDLSNEIATEFYAKTLEPGFSYEDAVNTGGLCARDLFNAIALVLVALQSDESRIPIVTHNIFVLVTGSRSSYAALDAATHIFKHGTLTISGCIVEDALPERESAMLKEHLSRDLLRRIKMLYKLPDHCFNLESMLLRSLSDAPQGIVSSMEANTCRTLVMGIEEDAQFGEGGDGGLPLWAVTSMPVGTHSVLLVKGRSKIRPFTVINTPRTFVLLIERADLVNQTFLAALSYVRPGDAIEALVVTESREPQGDCRDDRFGLGRRSGWVATAASAAASAPVSASASASASEETKSSSSFSADPVNVANYPGWNDEAADKLTAHLHALLGAAHIAGNVHVERHGDGKTIASSLCALALQVDADAVVLSRRLDLELCVDAVQEAPCSVLLL